VRFAEVDFLSARSCVAQHWQSTLIPKMLRDQSPDGFPTVQEDMCHVCPKCLARAVCRVKTLRFMERGEPPFVDTALCYKCYVCIPACPFEAISV